MADVDERFGERHFRKGEVFFIGKEMLPFFRMAAEVFDDKMHALLPRHGGERFHDGHGVFCASGRASRGKWSWE